MSPPILIVMNSVVEFVDHLTYLGSHISSDELVDDEVSIRIIQNRLTFAN